MADVSVRALSATVIALCATLIDDGQENVRLPKFGDATKALEEV